MFSSLLQRPYKLTEVICHHPKLPMKLVKKPFQRITLETMRSIAVVMIPVEYGQLFGNYLDKVSIEPSIPSSCPQTMCTSWRLTCQRVCSTSRGEITMTVAPWRTLMAKIPISTISWDGWTWCIPWNMLQMAKPSLLSSLWARTPTVSKTLTASWRDF